MKKSIGISVSDYIKSAPKESQGLLKNIRATIIAAAPGATERTDYFDLPGYSYEGYDYNGMFAWFSFKGLNVRLHVRPPVIKNHKKDLAGYPATASIVTFPRDKKIPVTLVKKLVKASIKVMKERAQ